MKILYIEDQLSQNIPSIIKMFKKYLGKKRIKQLNKMEESGRINSDKIVSIVEDTGAIDVAFTFPEALQKFKQNFDNYSMFIVDRNLSNEAEYDFELIVKIDEKFSEKQYDKYFEREGDYFLELLINRDKSKASSFFFLTANVKDELKTDDLENHIDHERFKDDNIIEKGNEDALIEKLNNIDDFRIISENSFSVLFIENNIGSNISRNFVEILINKDKQSEVKANLAKLRVIFENTITIVAKSNSEHSCWSDKSNNNLNVSDFLKWLSTYDQYFCEHKYKLNSSSVIIASARSIQRICSEFGNHQKGEMIKNKERYQPSTHTVNSLIFALKDIIVWASKIVS